MAPTSRSPPWTRSRGRARSQSQSRCKSKAPVPAKKVQVESGRVRKIPKPPAKRWFESFTANTRRARASTPMGRSSQQLENDEYDDEYEDDDSDDDDDGGGDRITTDDDDSESDSDWSDSEDDNPVDLKQFRKLWQSKHRSYDFTIQCENTQFRVHRHVLSARSPILGRMLTSGFKTRTMGHIVNRRATPTVVTALIRWMYLGTVDGRLHASHLCGLIEVADRFELHDLVDTVLPMICTMKKLDIHSFGLVLEVTDTRDLARASENNLKAFCKRNLNRLLEERRFLKNISRHRIYKTFTEAQRGAVLNAEYRRKQQKRKARAARAARRREEGR